MIVVIVEADFAPGDDAGMPRQAIEFGVMCRRGVPRFVRMNSYGGVDPVVHFGVRHGRAELFDFRPVADGEDRSHAGRARARQHGVAVGVEVGDIHVRV